MGDHSLRLVEVIAPGVQVAIEAWEVTAGDFDPDPVIGCVTRRSLVGTAYRFISRGVSEEKMVEGILPIVVTPRKRRSRAALASGFWGNA